MISRGKPVAEFGGDRFYPDCPSCQIIQMTEGDGLCHYIDVPDGFPRATIREDKALPYCGVLCKACKCPLIRIWGQCKIN
jgi:hypothetical protein